MFAAHSLSVIRKLHLKYFILQINEDHITSNSGCISIRVTKQACFIFLLNICIIFFGNAAIYTVWHKGLLTAENKQTVIFSSQKLSRISNLVNTSMEWKICSIWKLHELSYTAFTSAFPQRMVQHVLVHSTAVSSGSAVIGTASSYFSSKLWSNLYLNHTD
jgi:hypothetical protein